MAKAALVVVLPTPPLPDVITMILAKVSPSFRRFVLCPARRQMRICTDRYANAKAWNSIKLAQRRKGAKKAAY
jgi:hypothetical protein